MLGNIGLLLPQGKWRKLSINVASLFSVQFANYLLPLLTLPYVSRLIGPERSGLLMIALGYNHYFVLLINFGFDLSIVRLVATNRDNPHYINRIFSEVLTAKAILLIVSIFIFYILTILVPSFRQHLALHILTCFYCLGSVLFPQWLYQGMEDLSRIALFNLLTKILFTLGILLLIRTPDDYFYQNMAGSIGSITTSLVALLVAIRRYKLKFILPNWLSLYNRFKEGLTLFLSTVVTTLYSSSHGLLIGFVSTAYAVGVFTAASRLELIVRTFIYLALNQALFPIVAKAFGENKEKGINTVRRIAPIMITITIFISTCMYFMAPIVIELLYGDQFLEAVSVLQILAVLPIILSLNSLLGMHTLLNLHMDRIYFLITSCVSITGTIITYMSTKQYGALGTAIAWITTEALAVFVFFIFLKIHGIQVITLSSFRSILNLNVFKNYL